MKTLKLKKIFAVAVAAVGIAAVAAPTVKIDKIQQRYPWNGMVDIDYTLSGLVSPDEVDHDYYVERTVQNGYGVMITVVCGVQTNVTTMPVDFAHGGWDGQYRFTLDAAATFGKEIVDPAVKVNVALYPIAGITSGKAYQLKGDFLVINLEKTADGKFVATEYAGLSPIGAWDPGSAWRDEFKTTKIVMRKIPAGTYACRPDFTTGDIGDAKMEVKTPYYAGVFQVTEAQYASVMNMSVNPSVKPKASVSYTTIRGTSTPTAGVTGNSFMKILCDNCVSPSGKVLEGFDLPTEVQWEILARANSTAKWGSYRDEDGNEVPVTAESQLGNIAWYSSNSSSGRHDVGGKRPNLWGLYDTAGNVWEWCLDVYNSSFPSSATAETPYSGGSSDYRVHRGGGYNHDASYCCPSYRFNYSSANDDFGFRLVRVCK